MRQMLMNKLMNKVKETPLKACKEMFGSNKILLLQTFFDNWKWYLTLSKEGYLAEKMKQNLNQLNEKNENLVW